MEQRRTGCEHQAVGSGEAEHVQLHAEVTGSSSVKDGICYSGQAQDVFCVCALHDYVLHFLNFPSSTMWHSLIFCLFSY